MSKEEILAVFDENGEVTDKTVTRKEAHEKGILHGASHTYIYKFVNGKLSILLQRRSYNKDSFPGCLDISSAGHVEAGMDFEETAIKELNEELGIKVKRGELTLVFYQAFSNLTQENGACFDNREINAVYIFRQDDLEMTTLSLQAEEVSEVVWMGADEIMEKLKQGDGELCLDREEFEKIVDAIGRTDCFI